MNQNQGDSGIPDDSIGEENALAPPTAEENGPVDMATTGSLDKSQENMI
jgi:hypothetical protein